MKLKVLSNMRVRLSYLVLLCLTTLSCGLLLGCANAQNQPICSQHTDYKFAYTLCEVSNDLKSSEANQSQLAMYWWHELNKKPFYTFDELSNHLDTQGRELVFAVNGGMYTDKYAPLAYYVEHGKQLMSLNLKEGGGNFHLLPNGVFWLDKDGVAHVTESHAFDGQKLAKKTAFATQSGPMLVISGRLHPKFQKDSSSMKMRNGVGVCQGKQGETVKFVTSDVWVNFYDFAELFKNELGCDDALFLDGGRAPALYSQELGRNDSKFMGVMIGFSKTKH